MTDNILANIKAGFGYSDKRIAEIRASVGKPPENKRVLGAVFTRMDSTRLAGKAILPLAGKPNWWHCIQRVEAAARLSNVELADMILLIGFGPQNDIIEQQARLYGYSCERVPDPDLMIQGEVNALQKYDCGTLMLNYGDSPLAWYEHVPLVMDGIMRYNHPGLASWKWGDPMLTVQQTAYDVRAYPAWDAELLLLLAQTVDEVQYRGFIQAHDWGRRSERFVNPPRACYTDWPQEMWTLYRQYEMGLDWPGDAIVMLILYDLFYKPGELIDPRRCIEWLDAHPEYRYNRDAHKSEPCMLTWNERLHHTNLRWLDYAEFGLAPENATKLYCRGCGEYLGYCVRKHSKDELHRPDGSRVRGDAVLTCSSGHEREWHESA